MNFDKLKYYTDLLKSIFATKTTSGTVVSSNGDYAEIGEWADGNPNNEDRSGYFVMVDDTTPGITMVKGKKGKNIRGAVMKHPAFAGNGSSDKYDEKGNLLQQYDYVGWCGFVPVIDNGKCEINKKCICGDDGTAIPSDNDFGYQVIDRVDSTHVLVLIEPHEDEMNRIAEKVKNESKKELKQIEYDALSDEEKNDGTIYYITDGIPSTGTAPKRTFLCEEGVNGLRFFNNKLSYKNGDKWVDIGNGKDESSALE